MGRSNTKNQGCRNRDLKHHPRFSEDLQPQEHTDETADELARTAFADAATWPDVIRGQGNPMHTTYSHPSWHFIDIPFYTGGQTTGEHAPTGPGPHNIVEALAQCTAELKEPNKSEAEKAIDICWIAHLVGDIEQPLHNASMFSPRFPTGDAGGNDELVLRDPPYPDSKINLHLMWDSLPGDFASEDPIRYEAEGLLHDPRYSREKFKQLLANKDFMSWAKESHDLAVTDAYLNGELKSAITHHKNSNGTYDPIPGVPPGYVEKAEHIAMQQIALGGYRLADLLNAIYDPK